MVSGNIIDGNPQVFFPKYKDNRMDIVPEPLTSWWKSRLSIGMNYSVMIGKAIPKMLSLVKQLSDIDSPLMIGTDVPNPWTFAGFSVHDEMEIWQDRAGIPTLKVLQYATQTLVKFLGLEKDYGSVDVGKIASLVMLYQNPFNDVKAVRDIDGVFLNGDYFSKAGLDELMNNAIKIAKQPLEFGVEQ